MTLYDYILDKANRDGKTLSELAEESNVTITTILRTKKHYIRPVTIGKLCKVIDIDYDKAMELNNKMK